MYEGKVMRQMDMRLTSAQRLARQREWHKQHKPGEPFTPRAWYTNGWTSGYYSTVGPVIRPYSKRKGGTGGYFDEKRGILDEGSHVRLRVEFANEHLKHRRRSEIDGYYTDEYGDSETMKPVIARLPRSRGFLAGWTMGNGMATSFEETIWSDVVDAAERAHDYAERSAEEERIYQATRCEECLENAGEVEADDEIEPTRRLCDACRTKAHEQARLAEADHVEEGGHWPAWAD